MRFAAVSMALLLAAGSASGGSGTGTAAFNFLKIGLGARALGMGGAFTAVADDASATYWNPAGLVEIAGAEALAGYMSYMAGINSGFGAYSRPLGTRARLGVSINSLYTSGMEKRDANNNYQGDFGSSILIPGLSYAIRLSDKLSAGVGAKFVYHSIDEYTSLGAALDLGGIYTPAGAPYAFGAVLQNLGKQLTAFIEEKEMTPVTMKIGGVYRHKHAPFVAGMDLGKSIDSDFFFSLGAEYWVNKLFGLRLGYYSTGQELHSSSDKDILGGFSFGMGVRWKKYGFDYALVPMVDLGFSQRLSVRAKI